MSGSHGHDEPLPEPNTPMWLPALGAVLFLIAAIAWTMSPSTSNNATSETTIAAATASAQPALQAAPQPSAMGTIAKPVRRQPSPH